MNRSRGTAEPPGAVTGSPLPASARPNRLRRSFRQTQTAADVGSPKSQQPEFKTPTRIPRSRAGAGFSAESPNNDSDFQQDIIWDATSPSPNRLGKKGKKQKPPGVVDISEIVNRIAPKHGRPTVAEPTLQQWIGDSAAIPCTPDVQAPKPKKKSPRPNGVDDLLKLAKQFDFNMFRRDEEEEEVDVSRRQSPKLLSEAVSEDLEAGDRDDASIPASRRPGAKAVADRTTERLRPDQHMEDDLDFLFDGPTQCLSGSLSQVSLAQLSQFKPASREAAGKPPASSQGPASTSAVSVSANATVTSAKDEFEDDWDDDDLLDDSLAWEMTPDPQSFSAPRHSSTQKPLGEVRQQRGSPASGADVERVNVRPRATFKLEPNPNVPFQRIQTNAKVDYGSKDAQRNPFSSVGAQRTLSAATSQRFPTEPAAVAPAAPDLADEDLSLFFPPDPVWDDPADDDLLCEMCEDVENRLQSAENMPAGRQPPPPQVSQLRASVPPSNGNPRPAARQPFDPPKQTATYPGRPAGVSAVAAGVRATESLRCSQTKNTSGSASGSTWTQGSSRVPSTPRGNAGKEQFTFKKPNGPVLMVTGNAAGKCSAAEIEQKKQQAMERRRQRLQDARNLRAPT
ncbi:ewing's tumor-associated antigen 1-like [Clinocottus analis]|uniref:ewing's tumor-associated antigen 1-like n=1 Tax=Clinocottus analis TaxID=304258 RepID=UPI0035C10326